MPVPSQSEELLRLIVESSPHAMVAADEAGRIVLVNALTERLFGYGHAELIGASIEKLIPHRSRGIHAKHHAGYFAAPSVRPMSSRPVLHGLRNDGTEFPVSIHLGTIHTGEGALAIAWIADLTESQIQEQKLREIQELISAVNKGIPGAVFRRPLTSDGSLVYSYFAGRLPELWNLTAEDVQRNPAAILRYVHPDDLPLVAETLKAEVDDLLPRSTVMRLWTPAGELRWLELQTFADRQPDGTVVRNGIILDITERKRAEAALAESERRFRAMVDNIPGSVWQEVQHQDGTRRYTYMSEGFKDQTGWSAAELLANPGIVKNIYLESDELERETNARVSVDGLSFRTREFRIRHRDGSIRWMRARSVPHKTETGETSSDGVTIDVTEEKIREQALQEAQRRLKSITDNLPVVVFERTQRRGKPPEMTFVNSRVSEMLGVPPEQFIGKAHPLQNVMYPDDTGRVLARLRATAGDTSDWQDEFRLALPAGQTRWIRAVARKHMRKDGAEIWDGVYIDVTGEKEAQAEDERRARLTRTELDLAANLQQRFLWRAEVPTYLETALHFSPASQVSGDILFSKRTRSGDFLCFIGDATGHGVVAGLMTMLVVALLDSFEDTLTPGQILERLNNQLEAHKLEGMFTSGIALRMEPQGRLTVANGGHPAALIFEDPTDALTFVHSSGTPMGWFPNQTYEEAAFDLKPGATIVLYTDGLPEWPNGHKNELGADAVTDIVREHRQQTPAALVQALIAAALSHAQGVAAPDDVSVVALRYLGESRRGSNG